AGELIFCRNDSFSRSGPVRLAPSVRPILGFRCLYPSALTCETRHVRQQNLPLLPRLLQTRNVDSYSIAYHENPAASTQSAVRVVLFPCRHPEPAACCTRCFPCLSTSTPSALPISRLSTRRSLRSPDPGSGSDREGQNAGSSENPVQIGIDPSQN